MEVGEIKIKKPHKEAEEHKVVRTRATGTAVTSYCSCGAETVRHYRKAK